MSMRGVERQNCTAVTSAVLGVLRKDARTRMEFLELIRRRGEPTSWGPATEQGVPCVAEDL